MQVTSHLLIYSGSFPLLLLQVNDEDLASLLSLGYDEKMARRALRWSFSIDFLTIEASSVFFGIYGNINIPQKRGKC